MKKTTILIVDDHSLIRETWGFVFNTHPQFKVVGGAGSGEEGIDLTNTLRPDVVIMDINLPGINGIEATKIIKDNYPFVKVLGVSLHVKPSYANAMMQAGASGYVTKNSPREEMFSAVEDILNEKQYICTEIRQILSRTA